MTMSFYGHGVQSTNQKYRVQDVQKLVALIFRIGFSIAIAYVAYVYYLAPVTFLHLTHYMASGNKAFIDWTVFGIFVLSIIFGVRNVFRFLANWNGVIVDFGQGEISYPGGGVIRNKFSDLFRLRYLIQTCFRFHTRLNEIRMIEPRNITRQVDNVAGSFAQGMVNSTKSNEDKRRHPTPPPQPMYSTFYYLDFNGSFGAVSLNFASEGKRDEVYSFIRQYERMGVPVTKA